MDLSELMKKPNTRSMKVEASEGGHEVSIDVKVPVGRKVLSLRKSLAALSDASMSAEDRTVLMDGTFVEWYSFLLEMDREEAATFVSRVTVDSALSVLMTLAGLNMPKEEASEDDARFPSSS